MYNLIIAIQFICILFVVTELIYVYFQKTSKEQMVFMAVLSCVLINILCYTFEIMSDSKETALSMVKLAYVGKLYILPFFLFFCFLYCREKINKVVEVALLIIPITLLSFIFTAEKHVLYYSSISYTEDGVFPHLVLGKGIIYYVFLLYLFLYFLTVIIILTRRYRKIKDRNQKKIILYFSIAFNFPILGFIVFISGITKGYDTTALSFVISTGLLSILILKHNVFGTIEVAKEAIIDNVKIGAILIKDNEIIYANKYSEHIIEIINNRKEPSIFEWGVKNKIIVHKKKAYELEIDSFNEYHIQNLLGIIVHDITERYFYEKNLEEAVYKKTKEIQNIEQEFIITLASVIEEKDDSTEFHVKRTSHMVKLILESLKEMNQFENILTDQYCLNFIHAAPLHDIGKIKISDTILNKPRKLTEEEFEEVKKHAHEGAKIIENISYKIEGSNYLEMAKDIAMYHHEKWNGEGYPLGLKEEEIPLAARIMSVSDVFDALISKRIYKEAYSIENAIEIIKNDSNISFDPIIVEAFLNTIDKIIEYNDK
ncbi:MAG: histidine kinase N-terminal 7TM domain-containing protein [Lachnospiraceae bacterium]